MKVVKLTDEEIQFLIGSLDLTVKQLGLQAAGNCLMLTQKLQSAEEVKQVEKDG